MSEKQKLPKHIVAFEFVGDDRAIILSSKLTLKYWAIERGSNSQVVKGAVLALDSGCGWPRDSAVGKQIVF